MKWGVVRGFLRWCPGAVGIFLRQKVYPRLLGSCGEGVLFGRLVDLHNAKNIHIGDNVVFSNRCILRAGNKAASGTLVIGSNVFVGIGTVLQAEAATLHVRDGSNLGSECRVVARAPLVMGKNVLVAAYCVVGEEFAFGAEEQGGAATFIEDNVWLGARSHVLSSVRIGEGAIVGAHALVDRDMDAFGIVMGRPATVVRYRK